MAAALSVAGFSPAAPQNAAPGAGPAVTLSPCKVAGYAGEARCGTYEVFENRRTRRGRMLPLGIIVLPAISPRPAKEPVYFFSGGPGQAATEFASRIAGSWFQQEHDIVLIDERGTGEGHRLDCPPTGSDGNLEGYLELPYGADLARACRKRLEANADLSQYTTVASAEDVDEVRRALGHERIILAGGSFGTYAALVYMRAFGEHVHSAILYSIVTLPNRVPLYHAAGAQRAFDEMVKACAREPACHAAYPHPDQDLEALRDQLRRQPATVRVAHPVTGAPVPLRLSEQAFVGAVRVMMYSTDGGRRMPLLLRRAAGGDFTPFAETALRSSKGFFADMRMGLQLSVTCNEFVSRIHPGEAKREARGTYLGSGRADAQIAACSQWPKTRLPPGFFAPLRSDAPVVLVSGDLDPVIAPHWAEDARALLPNSIHVIVPGGHSPFGDDCAASIAAQVMRQGSVRGLDMSCLASMRAPPFALPEAAAKAPG